MCRGSTNFSLGAEEINVSKNLAAPARLQLERRDKWVGETARDYG